MQGEELSMQEYGGIRAKCAMQARRRQPFHTLTTVLGDKQHYLQGTEQVHRRVYAVG